MTSRQNMFAASLIVSAVTALSAPLYAQEAALAEIAARDLPVIVAVVTPAGRARLSEYGALAEDGIPPEETLVDLGSITKTITGLSILKLVENGDVELDETLGSIIPSMPSNKAGITVHQLLTHRAGLPEAVGDDAEPLSRDAFLARVAETPLLHAPGRAHAYSNTGYGVLAAIIELRSGKPYHVFLQEDLLEPAGLGPIGYANVYDAERSLLSGKTRLTKGEQRAIREASWGGNADAGWNLVGNGGIVATLGAFAEFWRAARAGHLIPTHLVEVALTPHSDEGLPESSFYGYGLVVEDMEGLGTVYWHDGGNDVFSAEWRDLGERGLYVTAGRGGAAYEAMELLIEDAQRD